MNQQKKDALQTLKTARGQLDGILRMLEEDRYCIDISNQILAAQSLLKRANLSILKQHLNSCVLQAVQGGDPQEKLSEISAILEKVVG